MIVALIPARGGSKRIPRKNIKSFCGAPIISYSIRVAQETGLFDNVLVSTDDEEIATVSSSLGASIPFMRPSHLSDDYATTLQVVNHAIRWLTKKDARPTYVCCIYPTAPFLVRRYILAGLELIRDKGYDFAFSATNYDFPVQRSLRRLPQGGVEPMFPHLIDSRSQDLESAIHDAGQFYWGKPKAFLDETPIFSAGSAPIVLPTYLVQDIDTLEDWTKAELMFEAIAKQYPELIVRQQVRKTGINQT